LNTWYVRDRYDEQRGRWVVRAFRGPRYPDGVVVDDEELTDDGRARLEALVGSTDGFALAATDLELRGAGQLFGRRQSGLPDLKLARIERDLDVIGRTRDLARTIVEADPGRRLAVHARMHAEVARRFADDLEDLEALETG
jgi:ATP-dependent DNA helicase RecG